MSSTNKATRSFFVPEHFGNQNLSLTIDQHKEASMTCPQVQDSHPSSILFDSQPLSIAFHPTENIIASALITGQVFCHSISDESNQPKLICSWKDHKKSCRDLEFTCDKKGLLTVSKDTSIRLYNMQTLTMECCIEKAHSKAINAVIVIGEHQFATGDDAGCIKVWDRRTQKAVQEYTNCTDYISDFVYSSSKKTLLATSGDGYLTAYDPRKSEMLCMSDSFDEDLLSIAIIKEGRKVICGSQEGVLQIFNWGEWGDISDRFPGHPSSIDTICSYNEDVVLTGSSDGMIRVVGIHPNQFLGVLGEHGDFPIEDIKANSSKDLLASCSHDCQIKFWNIRGLLEEEEEEGEEAVEEEEKEILEEEQEETVQGETEQPNSPSDDEDTSSDEEGPSKPKRNKKKLKNISKRPKNDFFNDL